MEKRSTLMKEKRRRRSSRLVEMTKNITESTVVDMVVSSQVENENEETKNEPAPKSISFPPHIPPKIYDNSYKSTFEQKVEKYGHQISEPSLRAPKLPIGNAERIIDSHIRSKLEVVSVAKLSPSPTTKFSYTSSSSSPSIFD